MSQSRPDIGIVNAMMPSSDKSFHEPKPKAFDAQGAIGKQFTEQGAIGGAAQNIGGPFDKDGAVGKQFTREGNVGGAVQKTLGGEK